MPATTKVMTVTLPLALEARIRALAAEDRRPLSWTCRDLLADALDCEQQKREARTP
jgi:predicted transcriptional regulator